jgi:hypothetical protein
MPDTNDLSHPTSHLAYIVSQYLSATLSMLPYAASLATLVMGAVIDPTLNGFTLAALTVFISLTVYVGIEFLREVRSHA